MFKKVLLYLSNQTKLWYDKIKVKGNGLMKNKEKGILDARTLACYIKKYYKDNISDKEISPIKLQKSLYFCFAYWGGFVRKMKLGENELNRDYNELLFTNPIEAWVYGPVVPEVYHEKQLEKYDCENDNPFQDDFIKEFIDGILNDVLNSNDFKLVEVSHQDKCWKKNFKPKSKFHNGIIPFEEIIIEYAKLY